MNHVPDISIIGFGEAGQTFARSGKWGQAVRVFDRLSDQVGTRADLFKIYQDLGVQGQDSLAQTISGAGLIISLVTADQAEIVAGLAAAHIAEGSLYLDFNSVAPTTKQAAARAIEASGGHYVDVAVMSPVQPAAMAAPLLVSGFKAQQAIEQLRALGFTKVRLIEGNVGRSSSIKMIRSVMIKGLEALSAECALAAQQAGVLDEVVSSLDASCPGAEWGRRLDYNLDRMLVHGARRSAEMQEVVRTLEALGTGADMSQGTVIRQAAIGVLNQRIPPESLENKLDLILAEKASKP